jgi:transcription termination factor Rho
MAVLDRKQLEESPLSDLHAIASELGIEGYRLLRREKLIEAILGGGDGGGSDEGSASGDAGGDGESRESREEERPRRRSRGRGRGRDRAPRAERDDSEDADAEPDSGADADAGASDAADDDEPGEVREGVLDILPNGSGFVRPEAFKHSPDDVYVSPAQIRRLELRSGDRIEGPVRPPRRNERHPSLARVDKVNGADADGGALSDRKRFDEFTPVFASQRLPGPDGLDAVPFGRGSRVAVGGPPGSGITSLLRSIVSTLAEVGDDLEVVVVLAGARPEEVTEWRRDSKVDVAGGGFDRPVDEQAQAAEMAIERGKRAVEQGRHAAIVIDSLDALPPSVARRVFGAARATEEAGTLTIVASTGLAGEPMRLATTRIVLEAPEPGAASGAAKLSPASGTLRAESLS